MNSAALPHWLPAKRVWPSKTLKIMKLMFVFMFAAALQVSANGYSQTVTINRQNVSLEKIFKDVKKQTGYNFLYKEEWVALAGKVSIDVKNTPLVKALDECFAKLSFTYEIVDNTIVMKAREEKKNLPEVEKLPPPPVIVKGTLKNDKNEPLAGASIIIKGSKKGTTSATDGSFSIEANPGDVLEFSMVGYTKQTYKVTGGATINFILEMVAAQIEEVVVIGYGTAKKSDLTGSVSILKPTETQAATSVSVDAMLQGKMPGVNVVNSYSGPGAANSVTIRGANSLRGDNQPLYVIDNIPQASTGQFTANSVGDFAIPENPLATLNPNDIESIQVLRDASATAIYGSRGANGVVIITTKKGKSGRPKITFSNNISVSNMTGVKDMLSLEQYGGYKNTQLGTAPPAFYFVNGEVRYLFSGATYNPNDPTTYSVIQEKRWIDEIKRPGISRTHDLSISGGTDKHTYFISGDHKDIDGVIKNTKMQVSNLRLNLNSELSKRLTLAISMSAGFRKNNMLTGGDTRGGLSGSIMTTSLYAAPFEYPANDPIWNLTTPDGLDNRSTPNSWLNDFDDIAKEKTFRGSAQLTWKISDAFSYNLRTGGNITIQERARWFGLQLFQGLNNRGYLSQNNLNKSNYTIENLLSYKKTFKKVAVLNVLAGATYDEYKFLNRLTDGIQFQNMLLRTNGMHFASVITPYQPVQADYQLLSYLSRVNLSFLNDKYLLTATVRADGSSKFSKENRWAYFPSLALAWRIDKENFIKNIAWVNQLKLRFGYGKTGNQSIDPYSTISSYTQGTYYANNAGDRILAVNLAGLQNKNIKWETTSSFNAGLDFKILNSRLTGSAEIYFKQTDDLLITRDIPPSTGFPRLLLNQGSLTNKGVEFELSGDIIRKKDFQLTLDGNISFNRSEITSLGLPQGVFGKETYTAYLGNTIGDHFGAANIFIQGQQPGLFWGYKTNGIYQGGGDTADVKRNLLNVAPRPGDVRFVDQNGDSTINTSDLTIIGNPNPKFIYGFKLAATYKNFSFSTSFNGVYGNQIFNANLRYQATPSLQAPNLRSEAFENAWTATNKSNLYPSVTYRNANMVMDRYIEDGSYLRWADLTLAYDFKGDYLKKIGLQSAKFYINAKNLAVFTNYSGFDPEVNSFGFDGLRRGVDLNSFPNSKTFTAGVNIVF